MAAQLGIAARVDSRKKMISERLDVDPLTTLERKAGEVCTLRFPFFVTA
tara:strand:+ start:230 stop:376 length:147 start_codon:yes stop_codon:yes gene_type:complete